MWSRGRDNLLLGLCSNHPLQSARGMPPICFKSDRSEEEFVKHIFSASIGLIALATVANAGTIQGKVNGPKGESVVYVEAIQGKTFPAPAQHQLMDQKGLVFA